MVVGAVFLVYLVSGGIHCVEGVHAYASLKTAGRLLSQKSLHLDLVFQIFGALMDVSKPVYLLSRKMGSSRHEIFILRILSQAVGHGYAADGRLYYRVVHPVVYLFSEHIYLSIQFPKALYIFC